MHASVEMLNRWGDNFLSFAWPMLWQSSLLILIVFAFDFLSARKIRASIRYALWMIVLVKLILPPAFALPTGATWWLWRPSPAIEAPLAQNYTVTIDETAPPANFVPQTIPIQLPPPELNSAAWIMLAAITIALALLLWLAFRWLKIARKVHHVTTSVNFTEVLEATRQLARLRRPMRLRLIDSTLSPAVYGLFRPVILLPQVLTEKLSRRQLRAVLLHEAIHLRRGDVWVNCAQTFLQIAYWWHPLLWFANARIRRVREEAVDDAVMVALNADADAYAPTLLEVAKLAFRRPLASLGLVGIMESRSALRQRIERLVDFRPPRKAGLTILSLFGIFIFSTVALPMGQGPEQTAKPAAIQISKSKVPWPDPNFEGDRFVNLRARFLILDDAQLQAAVPSLANARQPMLLSSNETGDYLARLTKGGARCFYKGWENGILQAPLSGGYQHYRIGSSTNKFALTTALTTNWGGSFSNMLYGWDIQTPVTQPDWTPMNLTLRALMQDGGTLCQMDLSFPNTSDRIHHSEITIPDGDALVWVANPPTAPGKRQVIILSPSSSEQKIQSLVRDGQMLYEMGKLDDSKSKLNNALKLDPVNKEARYFLNLISEAEAVKRPPVRSSNGPILNEINEIHLDSFGPFENMSLLEVAEELNEKAIRAGADFKIASINSSPADNHVFIRLPRMTNASLADVFDGIIDGSSRPLKYAIMDRNVIFSRSGYEMRTFKVDPKKYYSNLHAALPSGPSIGNLDSYFNSPKKMPNNFGIIGGESPNPTNVITVLSRQYFARMGLNLDPPKTLFFNDRLGVLFVYATPQDLDVIEKILVVLNDSRFTNSSPKTMKATVVDPVILASTAINQLVNDPTTKVDPDDLIQRTFPVDYNGFNAAVRKESGIEEPFEGFKQLAAEAGVDLSPPKTVWLDGMNFLNVRAPKEDMPAIQKVVDDLHCPPPQIHVKVRFIEMPSMSIGLSNNAPIKVTGILTADVMKGLLPLLESQKNVRKLAEPESTTLSGLRTEMRATIIQPIVTNYILGEVSAIPTGFPADSIKIFSDGSAIVPQIEKIETGPIFDVVPIILPGNDKIDLQITESLIGFLGYADTKNMASHYATNSLGERVTIPLVLPMVQKSQASSHAVLYDGQTLILSLQPEEVVFPASDEKSRERAAEHIRNAEKENGNETLTALVTVTLIDAAGNRLHSDDEMRIPENTNYFDTVPIVTRSQLP